MMNSQKKDNNWRYQKNILTLLSLILDKIFPSSQEYMYFHIDYVKLLYEVICIFSYLLQQSILQKVQS